MKETKLGQRHIAIVGGGASCVYLLQKLVQAGGPGLKITIFDTSSTLGPGMPYSPLWVGSEHLSNISCQEMPDLVNVPHHWLADQESAWLNACQIDPSHISEQYIFSRHTMGAYLADQARKILRQGQCKGITITYAPQTMVTDIHDDPAHNRVTLDVRAISGRSTESPVFDEVVIATGHTWPKRSEADVAAYFDSPWPSQKLHGRFNHPVGLLGSSLTAVDAVMTLAHQHGQFTRDQAGNLHYMPEPGTEDFRLVMHSRRGLLPHLRSHLDQPKVQTHPYISREEVERHIAAHDGLLSLDFLFEEAFKKPLRAKDPDFYKIVASMSLEEFLSYVSDMRAAHEPFKLLREEYAQSQDSLQHEQPMIWKEILDALAYTTSFHGSHLSAEDMIRFKRTLMPVMMNVIAFLPLESAEKLIALHDAGTLDLVKVGDHSVVTTNPSRAGASVQYFGPDGAVHTQEYPMFVRCLGQSKMPLKAFPFPDLLANGTVSPAEVRFLSPQRAEEEAQKTQPGEPSLVRAAADGYHLQLSGLAVNHVFQPVQANGEPNPRLRIIATPYISGHYPYHTGLSACDHTAEIVVSDMLHKHQEQQAERSEAHVQSHVDRRESAPSGERHR